MAATRLLHYTLFAILVFSFCNCTKPIQQDKYDNLITYAVLLHEILMTYVIKLMQALQAMFWH